MSRHNNSDNKNQFRMLEEQLFVTKFYIYEEQKLI